MAQIVTVPANAKPWNMVFAIAQEHISDSWLLVGGLMVQAHALIKGVRPVRVTQDADFLIDILSDALGVNHIAHALERHGYQVLPGTLSGYTTRMERPNGDKIDLMLADHLPKWTEEKRLTFLGQNHMFPAPGGAQAVTRSMEVNISDGEDTATIRIPDQLGALVFKAAARMADRGPKRDRHLNDAALLLSLFDDAERQRERLHSDNDRKRLKALRDDMQEHSTSITCLTPDQLADAEYNLEVLLEES